MSIDGSTPPHELIWDAPRSFFGAPVIRDPAALEAQVAFLGVPWDGGTPQPGNRTGQRMGPTAARLASWEQIDPPLSDGDGSPGWYDVEADRDYLVGVTMADVGDVVVQGADVEGNFARMTEAVRRIVGTGALLVAVGGDHSFSYPLVRGIEPLGKVDVVHVDAHADFTDEFDGARFSGGSQLRRIAELPFVGRVTAIGLRNASRDEVEGMRELGVRWATTLDIIERGGADVVRELVRGSERLYVSIDLDVLDIPWVPGTTLPEPGGLSYRQLRGLLAALAGHAQVIGFDVAELNPPHDPSAATARVATWLITHFLSEIFEQRR